jgi:hypothetical protein
MGISAAVAVVGIGIQAFGTSQQMSAQKKMADATTQEIQGQQQVQALQMQQQTLEARRKQLEVVRTQQRTRALALSTANSQGARLGSGLQGGYGQIQGASDVSAVSINQNQQLSGEQYGAMQDINSAKIRYASAGAQNAFGAGLMSLGGGLVTNSGTYGSVGSNFGAKFGQTWKA